MTWGARWGDLKEFLAEAQAADASFAHVYANKEKVQLAYYEWASARWNFTTQLSGLPAALKKEKEKQPAGGGHRPRGGGARRSREARQEEDQAGGLQGAN